MIIKSGIIKYITSNDIIINKDIFIEFNKTLLVFCPISNFSDDIGNMTLIIATLPKKIILPSVDIAAY
jgi:hypothetical protein